MSYVMKNAAVVFVGLGVVAFVGCTYDGDQKAQSTTRPSDAAWQDPYGKKWTDVNTDISGGGISNLNKDALKRDVDSTLLLK
jgi:hypothetical protein